MFRLIAAVLALLVLPAGTLYPRSSLAQTPAQIQQIKSDVAACQAADAQLAADLAALVNPAPFYGVPHKAAAAQDDKADMAEAVARGFGSRLALGPFRDATLAIRAWRADTPVNDLAKLQARLGRTPRFTPCQKATMAVIALEMVNSFSPGTIPPQVLAMAIQLQQAACGTPTPTPIPVPTPTPVPAPALIQPLPTLAR